MQLTEGLGSVVGAIAVLMVLAGCTGGLGEPCEFESDCEPHLYCETFPGVCGETGECAERGEEECPKNIAQECGCDGATYDNGCLRSQKGVAKFGDGICN